MTYKANELIIKRTLESGKTYTFKDDHNPRLPADYWFQDSEEGLVLFVVLFTQACRWASCLGCNLPSLVSKEHVSYNDIMKQVDFVFQYILSDEKKKEVHKIILSNNGSILDEVTLSTTALLYFVAQLNLNCPNIKVLTIETRPEYVDLSELELLSRALSEADIITQLEIAIGIEAFDDKIRNEYFNKGLRLEVFEKLAKDVSNYGFRLKTYFMLKPIPNLSEEKALEDIYCAIDYLDNISKENGLKINLHLNPTYAAKGTVLEAAFKEGSFVPPKMETVVKAVLYSENKHLSMFVGLHDEGLACEGGSFIRKDDEVLIGKLKLFNKTQDYSVLK